MRTVNATIRIKVKSAHLETEEMNNAPSGFFKRYRALELRAEDEGELAEQARAFALKQVRLKNKEPDSEEGPLVLVSVEAVEDVVECKPTCFTCIHAGNSTNQGNCIECNGFYSNWE